MDVPQRRCRRPTRAGAGESGRQRRRDHADAEPDRRLSDRGFVHGAAGWASVELDDVSGDFLRISCDDDSTYALQAFLGVAVPLSDALTLDLDLRYTYVSADNIEYDVGPDVSFDGGDSDVRSFSLTAGLRFDL
jgi:opacity protein-like surface antigen